MIRMLGYMDKNKTFTTIKDITEEEEIQIHGFEKSFGDYNQDMLLYKMVLNNYKILIDEIHGYEANEIDRVIFSSKDNIRIVELNRHILNFLTTFRTFIDHHETRFKREYGKNSNEAQKFKSICSTEFDNKISYRFFYKFRNYCQHCGVPISGVTSRLVELPSGEEKVVLNITLDRDRLLSNFDWGAIVKCDLENSATELDIKKLLIDFDGSIQNIHKGIVELRKSSMIESMRFFLSYSYRPELGLVLIVILTAKTIEEFKQGNINIKPVICSYLKEITEDLVEQGITELEFEGQVFLKNLVK